MHANSRLLFERFARPLFGPGKRVLEIGPDSFPSSYRAMVSEKDIVWDTLDIYDSPHLTFPSTPCYDFPIESNSYDIVLSGQVIEHVAKIWKWFPELARVTRPGGLVITINPVSWPYHEVPIDCWRIYPEGMKALCDEAGLSVKTCFCGSLEQPDAVYFLPGRSAEWQPRKVRNIFAVLKRIGFPVEKAADTITIAEKPAEPSMKNH